MNAGKSLDRHLKLIKDSFEEAKSICAKKIAATNIDVVVVDAPYNTINEIGIGGYTPSGNLIYISIDPSHDITREDLIMGYLHEMHHAMRWRKPGYGNSLKEVLFTEGLATLFEEEVTGITPIYAKAEVSNINVENINKTIDSDNYNHHEIFITGNSLYPRWFGYSYGYSIAKSIASNLQKTASELVNADINNL
jgi:uncharacterized protein YjaZ